MAKDLHRDLNPSLQEPNTTSPSRSCTAPRACFPQLRVLPHRRFRSARCPTSTDNPAVGESELGFSTVQGVFHEGYVGGRITSPRGEARRLVFERRPPTRDLQALVLHRQRDPASYFPQQFVYVNMGREDRKTCIAAAAKLDEINRCILYSGMPREERLGSWGHNRFESID